GLGEPIDRPTRALPGRASRRPTWGAERMDNTQLVGVSRQMVLQREMDVIANNIANIDTNGFKADFSLFEQYLTSGARAAGPGADRCVAFVRSRGTLLDLGQ